MADTLKNPQTPEEQDRSKDAENAEDKKLDRIADKDAKRAGETETRNDQSGGVVTW